MYMMNLTVDKHHVYLVLVVSHGSPFTVVAVEEPVSHQTDAIKLFQGGALAGCCRVLLKESRHDGQINLIADIM